MAVLTSIEKNNINLKKVILLLATFVLWAIVFTIQKPVFLLIYTGGVAQVFRVMWHGLPLDFSLAGYLSAVTGLLLLVSSFPLRRLHSPRATKAFATIHQGWILVAAIAVALAFVANLGLYSYWRFPLDATPVFFITSSPKDALASVEWWQLVAGVTAIAGTTTAIVLTFRFLFSFFQRDAFLAQRIGPTLLLLVCIAALFLPIRGGVTVSSMNTGKAYFSDNQILNHAAVNPLFSFMESMSHQGNLASQYRYMDDKEAHRLFDKLSNSVAVATDSLHTQVLNTASPDIYLLILESFSDTLTRQPGVTPRLNRLKQEGIWFSNFYANSFRTDRGLVAILQGYPSPATISLMKNPRLTASLPSLPRHLADIGYDLQYYYGGDADFTNMRSFLVNQGFGSITEDVDFPVTDRLSKWGVPDHLVFKRVETDLAHARKQRPMFTVIQTSSSHEPFDVPYHRLGNKILNAFAYTDSCVGSFVDWLKRSGRWQRSLVIVVPDHLGAWPEVIDNFKPWRFHIPMIWTGGAVQHPMVVDTFASQQDLAATLMGQLVASPKKWTFSKDIFHTNSSHYAFFMMNDGFGLVNDSAAVVFDNKLGRVVYRSGKATDRHVDYGKAITQVIFDDMARH